MLKNDQWIRQLGEKLIYPFEPRMIREGLSYGCGSFGYDIRLSSGDFRIFKHIPGSVVDPLDFRPEHLQSVPLMQGENGKYFILPAHTYGLGVAMERITVPKNITVICVGKSTYARCGIIANITPAEAGWKGNLTLEFSNSSGDDVKIYANKGIVQLLFLEGDICEVSYDDREGGGKYQNQGEMITLARGEG